MLTNLEVWRRGLTAKSARVAIFINRRNSFFARAILADPRILFIDDATSSVDTVTEQLIQSAIKEVTRGRTSFVIAHRLSTIRDADVILVVRGGRIVERGTHRELMRACGYYYSLYTQQYEREAVNKAS